MSEGGDTPPPSVATKTTFSYSDYGEYEEQLEGEIEAEWKYQESFSEHISEEEVEEEEEEIVYDANEFISKPYLSPKCNLPENILDFDYSYGYDCQRLFNLSVVDKTVLIYASGNIIHFLDTFTGRKWYRRSFSGCGIGHITTNPQEPHVAVGEKGFHPLIIIYEWPTFEIVTVLKGGTRTAYTFLNYSPDGELLCSQGDKPDYMLTVWNWRRQRVMLRSKAYGNTVFNSRFSLYVPGHLTTSGVGHIKFWKINRTFTGLKLLGELGRFGKSEICNVIGFLELPDEKVVSGCEWGNILVWDGGLIRVEVFRRGKNFCHEAPITQFIYNNGDLITVAMDGTIKVWYYETIELADPPEEDKFIEVEPIFEYEIGDYYHKAKLLVIVKADLHTPDDHVWYGQDGNGGIWQLDLSMSLSAKHAAQIFSCHAGPVASVQCSPFSTHFASLGEDGKLFIYDYRLQTVIMKKEFLAGGSSLLWLPLTVEESGCLLIGGFFDGVVRVICISLHEYAKRDHSPTDEYINLVQVIKAHTQPITAITINPKNTIIVTGSVDCTIFVFQIREGFQFPRLVPIGFVPTGGGVTHLSWKPRKESSLLVSCDNGTILEMELPTEPVIMDSVSYLLTRVTPVTYTFYSVKSEVLRAAKLREILQKREEIVEEKRKELKEKAEATGTAVDESIIEALQEELEYEDVDLPEVYEPPVPSPILFAFYQGKSIWLSVGDYDAGFLYEIQAQSEKPIPFKVPESDATEVTSHHYYHNNKYLILGMGDGKIRIVRVNPLDIYDLTNYWELAMHDNDNGRIRQIAFNYNYSAMFTCGNDGNVFSYVFTPEHNEYKIPNIDYYPKGFPMEVAPDIDDVGALSLEQAKSRIEYDEKMKEANAYKRDITELLKNLEKKFEALLRRNSKLPKSQQLTPEDLILDERIVDDLNQFLEEEMHAVKIKLTWQLEKSKIQHNKVDEYFIAPIQTHRLKVFGINNKEVFAETFRLKKLGQRFGELKQLVVRKLEEQEAKGRAQARVISEEEIVEKITRRPNPVEGLLKQIMALFGDYKKNIKLRRLLRKYRERKDKLETRRIEWYEMMQRKPNPEKPDPEDVASIELAKETIGDYQLKTASDYKVSKDARVTTVHVYDMLLKTRESIHELKNYYNSRVLGLRQRKIEMIERHEYLRDVLLEISKEIPKDKIRHPPSLPSYVEDVEFPEKKFMTLNTLSTEDITKISKNTQFNEGMKKKEIKPLDREYEMLITEKKGKLIKVNSRLSLMKFTGITGSRDMDELVEVSKDDQVMTPWEKECKKLRVIKRLYEQDGIIEEMDNGIKKFDEDIMEVNELRYQVEVDVTFLELFLLTLYQEVLILKRFEAAEEEKENKLFEKLREKHEMQKKMNEINNRVEGRNREIRRCEEEIKNLVTLFHAATAENKFYDFLKRIFKKKYRPPKVKTDDSDSDSESESSSSSEEEDVKSIDSKEIGPIRLDETVCPPGCDQQLYDWTFTQRAARHSLELCIMEERKQIDIHKKEYETLLKKIKVVETQYLACKEDLEEYMREKQRNLNEVETVIILRLSQIQNFKTESEIEKISESVVFSSAGLSNLYKRVGELEKETQMERQKHEKNRLHLTRMKIDVNHMREMIIKLTSEIDEAMIRKFGTKVDIDDIEESLLKRLVAEMHSIVLDLEKEFEKKLKSDRKKLIEKENEYLRKLQDNTERHNLLTVLEEEKARIQKALKRQDKILCADRPKKNEHDMENLRKIACMQETKIQELRNEIASLKLKCRPKPPLTPPHPPEVIQRILIKGCDGDLEEINVDTRNELQDMIEEAQEIAEDIKEHDPCEEDSMRMKKLTAEMIGKLPNKCKYGVLRHLSKGKIKEEEKIKCNHKEVLDEIVKDLKKDSFLLVMKIVKETIDSMIPEFESVEENE